jgi:serine/threonine protein kinase
MHGTPQQIQAGGTPRSDRLSPAMAVALEERLPTVPDYDLLRRIGGGAYGDVWLGRSQATGVLRAVKIVWRQRFEDDRPFQREFEGIQKFERISREHPSQLALFHIGRNQEEGYFYYVMELADPIPAVKDVRNPTSSLSKGAGATLEKSEPPDVGSYNPHTLRADLAQGRLPGARVVELGLALAEALGHLHQHGLVHRDVKPSNVIFVNGRPKLADIGLVTDASDQCSIVGTEGYLPPEGPGTPQADIFALGKVLYEAATGLDRRQFPDLPAPLKEWSDAGLVIELNQVVLKACAKNVDERYAGAEPMRRDLARLVEGKSVRRAHRKERRWQVARRSAVWLGSIAALFTLISIVTRVRQPSVVQHVVKYSTNEVANLNFELGKAKFDVFSGTNMAQAADYLEKAVKADPNFAEAYSYLAATYFWGGFDDWNPHWEFTPRAREAALRALKLDGTLAEPHLALGWYQAWEWNWREAEKETRRAVELNRSSPFCHLCYAELLRVIGRTDEALRQINLARQLDRHSRVINVRLIHYLTDAHRFKEALAQIQECIAMEAMTESAGVAYDRRDLFLALRESDKAIEAERDARIAQGEPKAKVEEDEAAKMRAPPAERAALIWRPSLEWNQQQGDAYLYDQACCHAQLGEDDEAFACLSKLLERRDTGLTFNIMGDWKLDPLRSHPRFHAILKAMHLE